MVGDQSTGMGYLPCGGAGTYTAALAGTSDPGESPQLRSLVYTASSVCAESGSCRSHLCAGPGCQGPGAARATLRTPRGQTLALACSPGAPPQLPGLSTSFSFSELLIQRSVVSLYGDLMPIYLGMFRFAAGGGSSASGPPGEFCRDKENSGVSRVSCSP